MSEVKKIVEILDGELLSSGKPYILLAQANKVLLREKVFTIEQVSNKYLKTLLESNELSHAYQTQISPKQWRIPLSQNNRNNRVDLETRKKTGSQNSTKSQESSVNMRWVWITIIFFLVGLMFFLPNYSKTNVLNSVQTIKVDTYAGTSEENFDEMFQYFRINDNLAIVELQHENKIKFLPKDSEVYILSYHYTHYIVREKASTEKLWVVREHITKE